jgi:hypothetical protein
MILLNEPIGFRYISKGAGLPIYTQEQFMALLRVADSHPDAKPIVRVKMGREVYK